MSTPSNMPPKDSAERHSSLPRPLKSEQLILDHLDDILERSFAGQTANPKRRALIVSPGRAQIAWRLARHPGFATIQAWYVDLHDAAQASESAEQEFGVLPNSTADEMPEVLDGAENRQPQIDQPQIDQPNVDQPKVGQPNLDQPSSVDVLCGADLPDDEYDLIAMPTLKRSEAEWTRELLQQAYQRLRSGGVLVSAVNNAKDAWLHDQLQSKFTKVTSLRTQQGNVYWAKKTKPLKKEKDFGCQFAFRDGEQLIECYSRPGVFSHRRLDNGARQLMLTAEIGPHDQVLDMGCGCGPVTLAAAFQTEGTVFGVDSNARAIQCLKRGAELNNLKNVQPIWNADGNIELPVPIDIALANPPYFAEQTIAQHFVDTALTLLRPGGALLAVTKQPSWYESYFYHLLDDVAIFEASGYFVACGRKRELEG